MQNKINLKKKKKGTRYQTQGSALTGTRTYSFSAKQTYDLYLQRASGNWHLKWGSVEAVAGTAVTQNGKG